MTPPPSTSSWSGGRRSFPTPLRLRILRRDGGLCQINGPTCTRKATEADHIIPHARGGTDELANGQAVCKNCHTAKTTTEQAFGRARHSRRREPLQHPGLN